MNEYLGIYTCLSKYVDEIWKKGLYRESNAFFVGNIEINDIADVKLKNTLAISVFHGISLPVWKALYFFDGNLNACMKSITGDEMVTMFLFKVKIPDKVVLENGYIYQIESNTKYSTTYPYYKVKDIGGIFLEKDKTKEVRIRVGNNDKINLADRKKDYPKFFFRDGGKQQWIRGITGEEIWYYCNNIAEKIIFELYKNKE